MDLKYITNANKDSADIYIYDSIGDKIVGSDLANEINYISSFDEIKKINVRINTGGGIVLDGFSIFAALRNSKKEIHTYNDGIAASMGGVILMAGDVIHAANYSVLMLHPVAGGTEKGRKAFQGSLIMILSKRSGQSEADVTSMMNDETWLNAQEAKEKGFVDEIYEGINKYEIDLKAVAELFGDEKTEKKIKSWIKNNNDKTNKMEKIKVLLKLDNNVSEDVVNDAVEKLISDNEALELANTDLKDKNKTLTDEVKVFSDEKETTLKETVENKLTEAVTNGMIKEDKKDELINEFGSDVAKVDKFLEAINVEASDITDEIKDRKKGEEKRTLHNDKTFRELEKEDPKALEELQATNKEKFDKMRYEEYGE